MENTQDHDCKCLYIQRVCREAEYVLRKVLQIVQLMAFNVRNKEIFYFGHAAVDAFERSEKRWANCFYAFLCETNNNNKYCQRKEEKKKRSSSSEE